MKIAVTGASGLIGSALVPALRRQGQDVVQFVRSTPQRPDERQWDPGSRHLDPAALSDIDAVVHLAGAGVADKRWTDDRKKIILDSRVDGTTAISTAIAVSGHPRVLLSASAIGWYGDTGDTLTDETGPSGEGFLADVVRQWEAATEPAEAAGIRLAHLRTGIVLSSEGGALAKQATVAKLGLGAPLGSGAQWMSWISLADEVAAIVHLLTADVSGPVNLVGPAPVINTTYTKALNAVLHRPTFPVHVPGFVLRAALGGFAEEGVLTGQRLAPAVLERSGFTFIHADVGSALRAALR